MTGVPSLAAAAARVDTGDTAWMLAATALVLLMTPALGLFYAGLVRAKNTLNTFMMCRRPRIAVATVTWAAVGYSLAFDGGAGFVGGLGNAFLHDVTFAPREGTTIPELVFFAFQATFCIVTTALVSGAVVERMRFGPFLVFAALWSVLVYARDGALGLRRRLAAGARHARLRRRRAGRDGVRASRRWPRRWSSARARTTGARRCCPTTPSTCCSARGCCGSGGSASTAAAASRPATPPCSRSRTRCSRRRARWSCGSCSTCMRGRQVTAIGAATAIIVGCVGITPAGGFVSPGWAMALGALAALPSYAVIVWRTRTRVDETLDVLAAHGVAGFTGILFIGFFAQRSWNGVSDGLLYGDAAQLGHQALAALVAPAYAFTRDVRAAEGDRAGHAAARRASARRRSGMDVVQHGEEAYASGRGRDPDRAGGGDRGRAGGGRPGLAG